MSLNPGTRIGCYAITAPLAAGGMGEVYRARDTELGRDVAIKVLPESFTSDAARVARFEQEAKTLAALNHPNIAQIYGLERSGATTALVMELVEGPTLFERIATGPLGVDEALGIAAQIAGALEGAHERGIVHRDLKPANIKLRPDGTVKVLDFGIAKALDPRQISGPGPAALTTPAMTEVGMVLGTAAYMSPEQARGKAVDQRADIWAFGCVLYEMLTGKSAFLGDDVTSTLARVLEVAPNWAALPSRVPAAVRRTLELCLEKDARKRLADMRDVRLALAGAFALPMRPQPPWRRALPVAAALLLGAVIAGAYFASLRQHVAPDQAVAAPLPVSRFVITPPATAPLANLAGLDLAISPDGQRIAYFSRKPENDNVELYVRELDALEARVIPGTEVSPQPGTMNPFFSPDGKSIGFNALGRGVVSVAIDGRPSVKVMDMPQPTFVGATWAADNTIVYSSALQLNRVSAAGGGTPKVLLGERGGRTALAPVLLPNGRGVVFHAVENGVDRVAVVDLETGQEKTLIEGGSNPAYVDTGHLVFARGNTLMAASFDAAELAITGDPVALVQGVRRPAGGAADYALSANGTLAYVPSDQAGARADAALVWVDRSGTVVDRAVAELLESPRDPRLSPDGSRLLLVTGTEADGDLWNYDLRGRPPIPLALPDDNRFPVWSPDGRQVAFLKIAGAPALYTVVADGSTLIPQRVAVSAPGAPHAWLADELIVISSPASPDIRAMRADGTGDVRPVVASEYREIDPALSPNARWLAYVSNRTGREEIWVQGYPDGAPPVRVSRDGGYEPQWSADGSELFFRVGDAMMAVAVEPGDEFSFATPQRLFSGPYAQRATMTARGYAVGRDGRFLMILPEAERSASAPASIVVVQNFTEEIKRATRSGR
jgi:serine/threonine-protein kinase